MQSAVKDIQKVGLGIEKNKEVKMKKVMYLAVLAGVFVVFAAGISEPKFQEKPSAFPSVVRVYLDVGTYCNDSTLICTMVAEKIYALAGWESGCGSANRIAHGSLRVAGGYAYFAVERVIGDNQGLLGVDYAAINLSTYTGTGWWSYQTLPPGTPYGAAATWILSVLGFTSESPMTGGIDSTAIR